MPCIYERFEFTANSVDDQKQLQPETIGAEAVAALRVIVLIWLSVSVHSPTASQFTNG